MPIKELIKDTDGTSLELNDFVYLLPERHVGKIVDCYGPFLSVFVDMYNGVVFKSPVNLKKLTNEEAMIWQLENA